MANYNITSWAELQAINSGLSDTYALTTNLDKNSPGYAGIGNNFTPTGNFVGTFDGNNFTISDLKLNTASGVGLGWVEKGLAKSWYSNCMSADGKYQSACEYGTGYIYVSSDYGNTWTQKDSARLWKGICMSADGRYQSACENGFGLIYVSSDYGNTWTQMGAVVACVSIKMSADGRYRSAYPNSGGQIYISSDYGNTWVPKDSVRYWADNCLSSDGRYQTACTNSIGRFIYVSSDYGNTWVAKDADRGWSGVCMSADGRYQSAVHGNGNIYISSDYGNTWTPKDSIRTWNKVCMSADGRYQFASETTVGYIYTSSDYGNTWAPTTATVPAGQWSAVCVSADGRYVNAIQQNSIKNIYISYDYGSNANTSVGLFSQSTGTISNLTLIDPSFINNGSVKAQGCIVGDNRGEVSNCHVIGDVTVLSTETCGGIVGTNIGILKKSSFNGSISAGGLETIATGGLVGTVSSMNPTSCIEDSYSNLEIKGALGHCGGVVGAVYNYITSMTFPISRCYSNLTKNSLNVYGMGSLAGNVIGASISDAYGILNSSYYYSLPYNVDVHGLVGILDTVVPTNNLYYHNDYLGHRGNIFGFSLIGKDSNRNWNAICMSADGRYQSACVNGGLIYISSDYGNTWIPKESSRGWSSICMSADGSYQSACHNSGQIYVSSDYGATWTPKDSNRAWVGICISADGRYQSAVVTSGQIYISSDYGNTWVPKDSNRAWYAICMSSDGRYQSACVNSGQIYVSSDYGNTWIAKGSVYSWQLINMSSDGKYQTSGVPTGQIYVSSDYGATWTPKDSNRAWVGICISADGRYQSACTYTNGAVEGLIYVSSDYGNTWTPKGILANWRNVCMSADGKRQSACVTSGKIYVYSNTNVQQIDKLATTQSVYPSSHPVYSTWNPTTTWAFNADTYPSLRVECNTWIGSGNWSTAANWSKGSVPTTYSKVLFNATSTNNCTIDVPVDINNLIIESTYSGTITHSANAHTKYFTNNT
jgi:hypothetical protein